MKRVISSLLFAVLIFSLIAACSRADKLLTTAGFLDLGEKYLLELNYEQALVQFLKVIEIEPMNPRGYTGAAESYIGLGQPDMAEEILRQGLEIVAPEDTGTLTDMLGLLGEPQLEEEPPEITPEPALISVNDGEEATLTGTVSVEESTHPNGTPLLGYILKLDHPVEVIYYDGSFADDEVHVFADLERYVGERITVKGEAMIGHTAWHLRGVCLLNAVVVGSESTPDSQAVITPDNILADMSKPERTALHTFFSNFSEVGLREFDADSYNVNELVDFALWHNYRNNWSRFSFADNGFLVLSSSHVEQSIARYFGITSVDHTVYTNDWNYYQNGSYYLMGANGEPLSWSQVTFFADNGDGTFTAHYDVYWSHAAPDNLYEDISDWRLNGTSVIMKDDPNYVHGDVWEASVYTYSCVALVAPHEFNGRQTYKLLRLTA
jgi:hypothetical protein